MKYSYIPGISVMKLSSNVLEMLQLATARWEEFVMKLCGVFDILLNLNFTKIFE